MGWDTVAGASATLEKASAKHSWSNLSLSAFNCATNSLNSCNSPFHRYTPLTTCGGKSPTRGELLTNNLHSCLDFKKREQAVALASNIQYTHTHTEKDTPSKYSQTHVSQYKLTQNIVPCQLRQIAARAITKGLQRWANFIKVYKSFNCHTLSHTGHKNNNKKKDTLQKQQQYTKSKRDTKESLKEGDEMACCRSQFSHHT